MGAGFLESVYQNALLIALRQKGLDARPQFPLAAKFRGEIVEQFYADILVKEVTTQPAWLGLPNPSQMQ